MTGGPPILVLHLIGLIMWMGGLLAALFATRVHSKIGHAAFREVTGGLFSNIAHPGVVLVFASGILLVFLTPDVLGERWFQVKLALVLGLILVHVRVFRTATRLATDEPGSPFGGLVALHVGFGLGLLGALVAALMRPE
jgi:uncharacterized membrane protein